MIYSIKSQIEMHLIKLGFKDVHASDNKFMITLEDGTVLEVIPTNSIYGPLKLSYKLWRT